MICRDKIVCFLMLLCVVSDAAEQVQPDVLKWIVLPSSLSCIINMPDNDKPEINADCPVVFQNSSAVIMSPHHPFQYPAGICCDWIVHAPKGQILDIEIIVLDFPAQTKGRCLNGYLAFGYFDSVERRIGGYSEVCSNAQPDVNLCKLGKEKVWVHFCSGDKITGTKDRRYSGFLLRLKLSDIQNLKNDKEDEQEKMSKVVIGASILFITLVLVASSAGVIIFIKLRKKQIMKQHQRRLTTFRMRHNLSHMIADTSNMPDEEQVLNTECPNIKSQMTDVISADHLYESIQERHSLAPHRVPSLAESIENTDQDSFTSVFTESTSYVNRSLQIKPFLSYITFIGTASRLTGSNQTLNDRLSVCCTDDGRVSSYPNNDKNFDDSSDQKEFPPKPGQSQQDGNEIEQIHSLEEPGTSLKDSETEPVRESMSCPSNGNKTNSIPAQQISIVRRYPRKQNRSTSHDSYRNQKKSKFIPVKKQTKSIITNDEIGDESLQRHPKLSEFTSTPKDFELMGMIAQPVLKPVPKINIFFPSGSDTDMSRSNYLSSISSMSSGGGSPLQISSSTSNILRVPKWKPTKQVKERYMPLPLNNSTGARRMSQGSSASHKSSATSLGTIEEEKLNT